MLVTKPKSGPAAGLSHEVTDTFINPCDQRKIVVCQFQRFPESFRGAQAGIDENETKADNVTSMMSVQQVHKFQNPGPMPLNTVLLADYKVYYNKAKFATRGDVVQVVFDKGQKDI